MSDRLTMQMGELQHAVKTSLDGLSRSLADLHIVIKEEREQRRWAAAACMYMGWTSLCMRVHVFVWCAGAACKWHGQPGQGVCSGRRLLGHQCCQPRPHFSQQHAPLLHPYQRC